MTYFRRIQSFVCRNGRMTESQREAINMLWPCFGLRLEEGLINFTQVFKRTAKCILEIGFGSGHSLLEIAKTHPEQDFIGVEMHRPGIGALLLGMQLQQVSNIRIYYADVVSVFAQCLPENSLEGVQIFFPDPWPKRRHHKRRLIQPAFIDCVIHKLKPEGLLHIATDWQAYAEGMMCILSNAKGLKNIFGFGQFAMRSSQRPLITKFEKRGEQAGRRIWELQFVREHP